MSAVEVPHFSLVQVAPWRGGEIALAAGLRQCGWELPMLGHAWFGAAGRTAIAVRPQRWLLLEETLHATAAETASTALLAAVGDVGAAVDVSSSRQLWRLSGTAARERLASGCRLDLHPTVFAPGHVAATLIAQVNAIVVARPEGWMLLAPTSTAVHFGEWLERATA